MRKIFFILLIGIKPLAGQNSVLESGIGRLNLAGCGMEDGAIKIKGYGNIFSNRAFFNSETTLDEIDLNFEVQVDSLDPDENFLFAIGKYSGIAGTMVEFKGTDSTTVLRIDNLSGTTPSFITQFVLPFNLTIGLNYKIRVGKRVRKLIIEVISDDGLNYYFNDSLSYPTPFFGCLWGTPFIGCKDGKISITEFSITTPFSRHSRLAVWGDSFIEGNSLPSPGERYVSLIQDSIGHQNVSILGRGGESSGTLNSRFSQESRWFDSIQYGLLAIGVNDLNFTAWKNNIQNYIDTLKKNNVVPIIATLSPRSDRQAFIDQVNNWIRNDYNGAYIDLNFAVSSTGISWLPGMVLSDNIHPSPVGHQAIYERIKLEAPYLFRETPAFTIDYINEITYENVDPNLEYSIFSAFSASSDGAAAQIPVTPGNNVFFRDTTGIVSGVNSLFFVLSCPARPEAPTNPSVVVNRGYYDWTNNPGYTAINDYEFSLDYGATWTTCSQKPITYPELGVVDIRVKASPSNFKGLNLHFDAFSPAIFEAEAVADVLIFPNPVSDLLTIKNIFEESSLSIYSAEGKAIKTVLLENETNTIATDELSPGFYILTLTNKTTQKSFKVFKK